MQKLTQVVVENGMVKLPVDVFGDTIVKDGDAVAVIRTDDGVYVVPQEQVGLAALARISELLKESDISLDELITSGRELRGDIIREKYGLIEST